MKVHLVFESFSVTWAGHSGLYIPDPKMWKHLPTNINTYIYHKYRKKLKMKMSNMQIKVNSTSISDLGAMVNIQTTRYMDNRTTFTLSFITRISIT